MEKLKALTIQNSRIAVTLAMVVAAGLAGRQMWGHYQNDPWTRDGRVRVDIVSVTPDVSGLVTDVAVTHDQKVVKGQPLFTIDRARFELALRQAEAAIATQKAAISVQQAAVAAHRAALAEAEREAARNDKLGTFVAREVNEQSHTKVAQEQAALAQAEAAVAQAVTGVAQAEAARDVAALNLERTVVRAPVDGMTSDISLRSGDYVSPGKPVLALIDQASLRVEGYFEETKLPRLHVGQKVEVHLMGEDKPLWGHIQSIAGAIEDRERGPSVSLLPNVNPSFSWVRLAQRIPVRVALDAPPPDLLLIAGRTASVSVIDETETRK
jgi:multidrug resistance efflux pump